MREAKFRRYIDATGEISVNDAEFKGCKTDSLVFTVNERADVPDLANTEVFQIVGFPILMGIGIHTLVKNSGTLQDTSSH